MSFYITLKSDVDGVVRKNLGTLRYEIDHHAPNVTLLGVAVAFPLSFDNADKVFPWLVSSPLLSHPTTKIFVLPTASPMLLLTY